jgi:hypothetical protein
VASSQHYARQHRSRYGPAAVAIPWGADPRLPGTTPKRRRPGDELRVLFVGQMRPYKGIETLLAAAAGQPWLKLTLVGEGTELAKYRRLAERLSVTNAWFTGRLPDSALHRQYGINDVVVLPSVTRAEAFGLVLLDGMATGCVPVASDLPGVRDVAGPTGLVVPPGDAEALRAALRGLACDAALLDRLANASRRAAQALTWDRCVASYERVMLDAIRGRYARLHGVAMLPELNGPAELDGLAELAERPDLDEAGRSLVIATPGAGPHHATPGAGPHHGTPGAGPHLATPGAGPHDDTLPGAGPHDDTLPGAGPHDDTLPGCYPVPVFGRSPEAVTGVPAGANQRHR